MLGAHSCYANVYVGVFTLEPHIKFMVGLPRNPYALAAWMQSRIKHGAYSGGKESPEHYLWRAMHRRCRDPAAKGYQYYGGRGVRVCERWNTYELFLADMGQRPTSNHQLDRINADGDYEPSNCRWVTRSAQQKNKRTTKRWVCDGKVGTLSEWAEQLGVSVQLAKWRMKHWGTFEKGRTWQLLSTE